MSRECPNCLNTVDASDDECISCGYSLSKQSATILKSIVRSAKSPPIPIEITMGITVDRTASSNPFRDGIDKALEMSLKPLETKVAKISIYLQSHGDLDYDEKEILLTREANVDEVIGEAKKIVFEGGGDSEETHLDAIEKLSNTVPWKYERGAKNVMIIISNAETKNLRSGKSPKQLGTELANKDILVFGVCEITKKLQEFFDATSAISIPLKNDLTPSEFNDICNKLTASIVASVSQNSGTVPWQPSNQ